MFQFKCLGPQRKKQKEDFSNIIGYILAYAYPFTLGFGIFRSFIVIAQSTIISSLKCAKCQIFGTFGIPIIKIIPHQLFQISKNLRHGYSTISNMRRYGHQCQTLFGLFNSFFLSPPIRCISHSLSVYISRFLFVYISRSLCLAFSPRLLASPILPLPISPHRSHHADLTTPILPSPRDRDRPGSPLIIDPLCDKEELQCEGTVAGSENFHQ